MTTDTIRQNTVITAISKITDRTKAANACLVVIYGRDLGKKFTLKQAVISIGRSTKSDIQVEQDAVSRNHCKITNDGKQVIISDLGSTNGTYVNDELISKLELADGDFIKVGRMIFKYLASDNIESAYHEEIYRLTTMDGLTQIYNRRYLTEQLNRELGRALRYRRDLSVIIFDIDHFKGINDTHGHLAGDYVLKQLATVVRSKIRREDVFARYGGEEFCVLLPEADRGHASQFAEKIRKLTESTTFQFEGESIRVTVSLGVAALDHSRKITPSEFLQRADELLYEAKRNGRNCVMG